jgi:hypothetical protein
LCDRTNFDRPASAGPLAWQAFLNTAAFEFAKPKRWVWGAIDATYHAIGLLIAAVILALIP